MQVARVKTAKKYQIQFAPIVSEFEAYQASQQYLMVQPFKGEPTRIVIDYVGDRWARGHSDIVDVMGVKQNIPWTISYADVLSGFVKVESE